MYVAYYIVHTVLDPTTAVVSKQSQSGHYRGQLNTMYQNKMITKPEIEEIEHQSETGGVTGYTGIVKFEIVATREKMLFRGSGPSKSAAHETAAQTAVNKIRKYTMRTSTDCENNYRRTGFNCENLLLANYEFF